MHVTSSMRYGPDCEPKMFYAKAGLSNAYLEPQQPVFEVQFCIEKKEKRKLAGPENAIKKRATYFHHVFEENDVIWENQTSGSFRTSFIRNVFLRFVRRALSKNFPQETLMPALDENRIR